MSGLWTSYTIYLYALLVQNYCGVDHRISAKLFFYIDYSASNNKKNHVNIEESINDGVCTFFARPTVISRH